MMAIDEDRYRGEVDMMVVKVMVELSVVQM